MAREKVSNCAAAVLQVLSPGRRPPGRQPHPVRAGGGRRGGRLCRGGQRRGERGGCGGVGHQRERLVHLRVQPGAGDGREHPLAAIRTFRGRPGENSSMIAGNNLLGSSQVVYIKVKIFSTFFARDKS